ncbi:MAG: class I SAM-dependent methyltransferase [Candidatus Zixiibacteriota bacterium]|jgi:demethylmenaquinone methyltransferase/2-methoxy-6-polyprenyl-1,4-benzoquinol methylase
MTTGEKPSCREFFDGLAAGWDDGTHHDPEKLAFIADLLALRPGHAALDVGCGTGVMVPQLLARVANGGGGSGRVVGVDFSAEMIAVARRKFPAVEFPNVEFLICDVDELPEGPTYDGVVCYSCFPHFRDQAGTTRLLARRLRPGGRLLVAHSESRDAINDMHRGFSEPVRADYLPPVAEIGAMMEDAGLAVVCEVDSADAFVVGGELRPSSRP